MNEISRTSRASSSGSDSDSHPAGAPPNEPIKTARQMATEFLRSKLKISMAATTGLGLLAASGFFVSIGISDPSTVHGMTALAGASALLMLGSASCVLSVGLLLRQRATEESPLSSVQEASGDSVELSEPWPAVPQRSTSQSSDEV